MNVSVDQARECESDRVSTQGQKVSEEVRKPGRKAGDKGTSWA